LHLLIADNLVVHTPRKGFTVKINIKPGLLWSDGQPLTLNDLKYTWQWVLDKDQPGISTLGWDKIDRFDVSADGLTAEVHFTEPYAGWLGLLVGSPPLPEHYMKTIPVKEANTNLQQVSDEIAACPGILVYSGIEALCFPMLALGGTGHVSATANVMPREVAQLYDLCAAGRWEEARALHYRLLPLNEALFLETNPGPVKTALGWMGKIHPALRLPLAPPGEAAQAKLRRVMEDLGLLGATSGAAI
ncbi:MAG: dihydrodipicolinate synthase family protein, partial [Candidatus Rokubacteria bacterium]|nr:dihydrodipicolinate synthase family protein [Candidatus Rokubacteria bacterium]